MKHATAKIAIFWAKTTGLGPRWLFLLPKTEGTDERKALLRLRRLKKNRNKSCWRYQKARFGSISSVLYIWGGLLWRRQDSYWYINKYFLKKFKIAVIFFITPRTSVSLYLSYPSSLLLISLSLVLLFSIAKIGHVTISVQSRLYRILYNELLKHSTSNFKIILQGHKGQKARICYNMMLYVDCYNR